MPENRTPGTVAGSCPRCEHPGKPVRAETVKSLLRGSALERRQEKDHRFCPQPDCEVVYFGREEAFSRNELTVPVFQKEPRGGRVFCYCLAIPEEEIGAGRSDPSRSDSFRRIETLVRTGRCACRWKAPQGVCCLGNLSLIRKQEEN